MLKRLLTASAALLVVSACEQTPVEAPLDREAVTAFAPAEIDRIPFAVTAAFPCGEVVDLDGFLQFNDKINVTPSGQVSGHSNYVIKVTGIGQTSGAKYEANETGKFSFHLDDTDGFPAVFSDRVRLQFVGQGQAPNYTYSFIAHFTVDANGVVRVDRSDETSGCS